MQYYFIMVGIYDERYIQSSKDRDFGIYERKFENLTRETVFTHMHFHRDFEILYVIEGCAQMQVAGETFLIGPKNVALINPYEPHYGKIISEEFHYICIDFNFALLSSPHEKNILEGQLCYANLIQEGEKYSPYLFGCYDAVKNSMGDWKMRAIGNLLLFFSYLGEYIKMAAHSKEYLFAKKTLEMLRENYSEKINTRIMAEAFSYNESYFCRKFQKVFNCSFSEYLKNYRISQAKKILKYRSVSEVAMETGFSSIQYFSRIFKEITGMCPIEYKRTIEYVEILK